MEPSLTIYSINHHNHMYCNTQKVPQRRVEFAQRYHRGANVFQSTQIFQNREGLPILLSPTVGVKRMAPRKVQYFTTQKNVYSTVQHERCSTVQYERYSIGGPGSHSGIIEERSFFRALDVSRTGKVLPNANTCATRCLSGNYLVEGSLPKTGIFDFFSAPLLPLLLITLVGTAVPFWGQSA